MPYQKRSCARIKCNIAAEIAVADGQRHQVQINNISTMGFQFYSPVMLNKGDELWLRLRLPGTREIFELQIKIQHRGNTQAKGWIAILGVQITAGPENWLETAGNWIQMQAETHQPRKWIALLLGTVSAALIAKAALTAFRTNALQIPLRPEDSEFTGLIFVLAVHPLADILMACYTALCAWIVLIPQSRHRHFQGKAVLIAAVLFSWRLAAKVPMIAAGYWGIYAFDLAVTAAMIAGGMGMYQIERHYRRVNFLLQREGIYPGTGTDKTYT